MTFAKWLEIELSTRDRDTVLRRSGLRAATLDSWLRGETWPTWVQSVLLAQGLGVHWVTVWSIVLDDAPNE